VGVPFEIVPGVSSVNGVPAYANIPLTHPEFALCLVVITGKKKLRVEDIIQKSTFVVLMGKESIKEVAQNLITLGVCESTKVAIIERGTLKGQRMIYTTLKDILEEEPEFENPALIVIGNVVEFSKSIWETREKDLKNSD
jgi:siroheme synthase